MILIININEKSESIDKCKNICYNALDTMR